MTCADLRDRFSARVDEALTAEERAAFDAHLGTCADCRREWRRFELTVGLVRGVEAARAPAGFVDRVLAAARPHPWYRRLLRELFVPWPVKLPLEAAAVVLVAGLAIVIFQRSPELEMSARAPAPLPASRPSAPTALAPTPSAPTPPARRAVPNAPPVAERRDTVQGFVGPSPRDAPSAADRLDRQQPTAPRMTVKRDLGAGPSPPPAASEPHASSEAPAAEDTLGQGPRGHEPDGVVAPRAAEPRSAPPPSAARARGELRKAPAQEYAQGVVAARMSAPLEARLTVGDRATAEREIVALVSRLGGTSRPRAPESSVLELFVPRESYATLTTELTKLGRLQLDREPPDASTPVHLQLRLE